MYLIIPAFDILENVLPSHILKLIFIQLDLKDFLVVSTVSKKVREISEDNGLWTEICELHIPFFSSLKKEIPSPKTYLQDLRSLSIKCSV